MSGPTPKNSPDPDAEARRTTGPRTRQEQLETAVTEDAAVTGAEPSRAGGALQRDVATKDELRRETEGQSARTRVHKSEEKAGASMPRPEHWLPDDDTS